MKCGTKCCWQIITFSNDPLTQPNLLIYLIVCPGDVVDRLPESITPRKRQNSIGEAELSAD
jgi:hypothetical protein